MTIEELRDYVEEQRSLNNIPYHVYSELIDGIDTLEQEPKTDTWSIKDVANTFKKHGLIVEQAPCEDAISRQAVLDLAKKGVLISNGNYESVCKAINEIPSANPIEPCKDAIDRAEAIKIASGYCHPANVAKELAKMPPVTPQPKTGHWIGHREHCENLGVMPSGLGAYEWCSNCDCGIDVREWHRNNYNYCPNCGAKMVEPQESEEKEC